MGMLKLGKYDSHDFYHVSFSMFPLCKPWAGPEFSNWPHTRVTHTNRCSCGWCVISKKVWNISINISGGRKNVSNFDSWYIYTAAVCKTQTFVRIDTVNCTCNEKFNVIAFKLSITTDQNIFASIWIIGTVWLIFLSRWFTQGVGCEVWMEFKGLHILPPLWKEC